MMTLTTKIIDPGVPMSRFIVLLLLGTCATAVDALIIDPAGAVTVNGSLTATGPVTAGNVVINRSSQATTTEAVRGDDPRVAGGGVRAWVNFNGKTLQIRSSFNVSSIQRLGTGAFKVVFTNAFPSTNYVPMITCGPEAMTAYYTQAGALATDGVSFVCINGPLQVTDPTLVTVAVVGF